jgi:hypothetical protein
MNDSCAIADPVGLDREVADQRADHAAGRVVDVGHEPRAVADDEVAARMRLLWSRSANVRARRLRSVPAKNSSMNRAHDLDIVGIGDFGVGLRLEQPLDVEVVQGADDRAAGHGRDHLDPAQQPHLRHPREHADVEERGAKAAPRQREAELGGAVRRWIGGARRHGRRAGVRGDATPAPCALR